MTVIDSCDCTWYFDTEAGRFRSTVKGMATEVEAAWLPYYELIGSSDGFVVVLDREATRRVRYTGTFRCVDR